MKLMKTCWLLVGGAVIGTLPVRGASDSEISELRKEIQALRQEVSDLKKGTPAGQDADGDALLGEEFMKAKGLTFSFYGESKYRFPQSGPNSFDAHRYVFGPHYQINDWLVFNSELELEHGGVDESANNGRNRYDGELELEQFYVDILINEHFNIRSLGLDLIPVGRINPYHEPTLFYSTERPELYREIIPSTWMEPSMSVFGKITETLDYRLMISAGLEDAIPTAGSAASAATGRVAGYASPGVTAANGMRDARPRMRRASANSLAYSGRLHYSGVTGLDTSASFYVTQIEGLTNSSMLALFDVEALYRVPKTGLELRGDFAYWFIDKPENLVANQNNFLGGASLLDDVGEEMYGWYAEAAYHLWPEAWREGRGENMDLVPFVRFTQIVTQSGLLPGSTKLDNGTTNRDFVTAGLAYFLNQSFVVKADWRHNLDKSSATEKSATNQDYFQIGAGMAF